MLSHYQNYFEDLVFDSKARLLSKLKISKQLLGILALFFMANFAIAQQGDVSIVESSPVTLSTPTTAGDDFLPQGNYGNVEVARLEVLTEIVPLPIADYTGNFSHDVEKYKEIVQRWMLEHPESLAQQDNVTQKLIALGYYDTLFKWQVQRNNINKITK